MRNSIPPRDPEYLLETLDVKVLQQVDVAAVGDPCLAAVQESGDADCLVYCYFGGDVQVAV